MCGDRDRETERERERETEKLVMAFVQLYFSKLLDGDFTNKKYKILSFGRYRPYSNVTVHENTSE